MSETMTERTLRLMREEWEAPLRAERDRYLEVIATLRDYIAAREGDGPVRYIEALALADGVLSPHVPTEVER